MKIVLFYGRVKTLPYNGAPAGSTAILYVAFSILRFLPAKDFAEKIFLQLLCLACIFVIIRRK